MERESAHFRQNSSDLFICLSSSSSMKLSKSILSPAHRLRPSKASPFFPKKRLDAHEPSSPKVTCIGQVRVKSKKKKKKRASRSLSARRAEASFRKIEAQQRSQGWVHLPVSICDALRTCFSVEGRRREIELVVGAGFEEDGGDEVRRRRHVLEDVVVEEEAARVSICIPPKNALLLMRCRSDPMKMAALANRFHVQQIKEEELEIYEVEDNVVVQEEEEEEEEESNMSSFEALLDQENAEKLEDCCPIELEESSPVCHLAPSIEEEEETEVIESINGGEEKEQESSVTPKDSILLDNEDGDEDGESSILVKDSILVKNEEEDDEKEQESSSIALKDSILSDKELQNGPEDEGEEATILPNNENEEDEDDEKEKEKPLLSKEQDSILLNNEEEEEQQNEVVISEKEKPLLPECLLLMMREPKLSMEVSRETWVCSTDFTKARPRRGEQRRLSVDSKAKRIQPPRSSCSLASMIQQKLANAAAHEPLVLTRCKSAPMRVVARSAGVGV
ncbi:glutamic acid-rich protein-like [Salvia hispanica]|uniref:glutamic acid-rich protein-like n=1 Tax=Salvia hispanica TaxID=49212 RepID=UPI0020099FEA|nr:glutamic acid-rich protein-like [Salvia hispanica]